MASIYMHDQFVEVAGQCMCVRMCVCVWVGGWVGVLLSVSVCMSERDKKGGGGGG